MASRRFSFVNYVLALALATGLWTYVSLSRNYEYEVSVPLVVIPPPNQALLSTVPFAIQVRVRATGLQLLNLLYVSRNISCTLDLGKARATENAHYVFDSPDILRNVVSGGHIRSLAASPATISFATGDLASKTVPLYVPTNISCRAGFIVASEPKSSHQLVEIRGTRAIVEGIEHWRTQRIELEDLHAPQVLDVPLSDSLANLVNVVPSTVRVRIDVQQQADVVIADVPVVIATSNQPKSMVVRPTRIRVVLRGGVDDLASITARDLRAEIVRIPSSGVVRPVVTVSSKVRVVATYPRHVRVVTRAGGSLLSANDER